MGVSLTIPDGYSEEYAAICKKLGINTGAPLEAELQAFLARNGICVYPRRKVREYMDALIERERKAKNDKTLLWYWKPLRGKDKLSTLQFNNIPSTDSGRINVRATYRGIVPLPALMTVDVIVEHFGDRVVFFVSDYISDTPDPFLLVAGDGASFIVESLDEPGFRI